MSLPEEIKRIRQRSLLTQEEFADVLGVSFSTVNRWEGGHAKPNMAAMKSIKAFCERNRFDYALVEEAWLDLEPPNNQS